MKRKYTTGLGMMRFSVMLYIIENFYFGWNAKPMSSLEQYADNVVGFGLTFGFLLFISPAYKIYKTLMDSFENED